MVERDSVDLVVGRDGPGARGCRAEPGRVGPRQSLAPRGRSGAALLSGPRDPRAPGRASANRSQATPRSPCFALLMCVTVSPKRVASSRARWLRGAFQRARARALVAWPGRRGCFAEWRLARSAWRPWRAASRSAKSSSRRSPRCRATWPCSGRRLMAMLARALLNVPRI